MRYLDQCTAAGEGVNNRIQSEHLLEKHCCTTHQSITSSSRIFTRPTDLDVHTGHGNLIAVAIQVHMVHCIKFSQTPGDGGLLSKAAG